MNRTIVSVITLALTCTFAPPSMAQSEAPVMNGFRDMYIRIDAAVTPYVKRWGLPNYWVSYCNTEVNADEDRHKKDGSIPLGIEDWRSLDPETFKVAISTRTEYRTAKTILCLAHVKADLLRADGR